MKIRLLTALIATACLSQAVSAHELTSGGITNQTTATADVMIGQPVTLENTLTPVHDLKAGEPSSPMSPIAIATGNLAIKETGVTAQLALKITNANGTQLGVYAKGHPGDAAYELIYAPKFNGVTNTSETFTASDGIYIVSKARQSQLLYNVVGSGARGDVLPGGGKYTISVTGAVYTP